MICRNELLWFLFWWTQGEIYYVASGNEKLCRPAVHNVISNDRADGQCLTCFLSLFLQWQWTWDIFFLFIIVTDLQISTSALCSQIAPYLLWTQPLFHNFMVKLASASMQIISKYYCSVIRCHKQPRGFTFVWLTLMKVLISLLMRSLSSAFFSLHLWPEYLWKIWMIETIPFSSSDMLSSKVCSRQFHQQMCDLKISFHLPGQTQWCFILLTFIGDSRRGRPADSRVLTASPRLHSTLIRTDETHACFCLSCAV